MFCEVGGSDVDKYSWCGGGGSAPVGITGGGSTADIGGAAAGIGGATDIDGGGVTPPSNGHRIAQRN
nr:hypothetical protein [Tanacetum cinerariifolium]